MHNLLDFYTLLADMLNIGGQNDPFSTTSTKNEKANEQTYPTEKDGGRQLFESFSGVIVDEQGRTCQKGPSITHYYFQNRRRLPVSNGYQTENHSGTWPKTV